MSAELKKLNLEMDLRKTLGIPISVVIEDLDGEEHSGQANSSEAEIVDLLVRYIGDADIDKWVEEARARNL